MRNRTPVALAPAQTLTCTLTLTHNHKFNLKEEALRRRTNDAANACVATKKEIESVVLTIAANKVGARC